MDSNEKYSNNIIVWQKLIEISTYVHIRFDFHRSEAESSKAAAEMSAQVLRNFVASLIDYPKILVAAVNGSASGIAVIMLNLFDAVYLSDQATFRIPLVSTAQTPGCCGSYTFPKIIGKVKVL